MVRSVYTMRKHPHATIVALMVFSLLSVISLVSLMVLKSPPKASAGEVPTIPSKRIFIGDSRTHDMYSYLTGTTSSEGYDGATRTGFGGSTELWYACGGFGIEGEFDLFNADFNGDGATVIDSINSEVGPNVVVVCWLGVNDMQNVNTYISRYNAYAASWVSKGAQVYYASVGPTRRMEPDDRWYAGKVVDFNNALKAGLNQPPIRWIDAYSFIMGLGDNAQYDAANLHYLANTSNQIYDYIAARANYYVPAPTATLKIGRTITKPSNFVSPTPSVANIVYDIYNNSGCTGSAVASVTIGSNGWSNSVELDKGTYYARERSSSVPGAINADSQVHQINLNDDASPSYSTAVKSGSLKVTRTATTPTGYVTDGRAAPTANGIIYDVYNNAACSGNALTNLTSGATVTLTPGSYWLKERASTVPAGVAKDSQIHAVSITNGGSTTPSYSTALVTGSISVTKKNHETNAAVAAGGFTFAVYKSNGTTQIAQGSTTNGNATVKLSSTLAVPGTYVIKETAVPAPWVRNTSSITVNLTESNPTQTKDFEGNPQYGRVTLTKTDATDNTPQKGAKFKIIMTDDLSKANYTGRRSGAFASGRTPAKGYPVAEMGTSFKQGSAGTLNATNNSVTVTNPVKFITSNGTVAEELTTGDDGKLVTCWLPIGAGGSTNYALVETSASPGHLIDATPIPFKLSYAANADSVSGNVTQKEQLNSVSITTQLAGTDSKTANASVAFWSKNLTVQPEAGHDAYALRVPNGDNEVAINLILDNQDAMRSSDGGKVNAEADEPEVKTDSRPRQATVKYDGNSKTWVAKDLLPKSSYQVEIDGLVVKILHTSDAGGKTWFGRYANTSSAWFANHYVDQGALPSADTDIITKSSLSTKEITYGKNTNAQGSLVWRGIPAGQYTVAQVLPASDEETHKATLPDTTVHTLTVNATTGYVRVDAPANASSKPSETISFNKGEQTSVSFSKKDSMDDDKSVEGSYMILTSEKDNVVVAEWVTGSEPQVIVGLAPGRYVLSEHVPAQTHDSTPSVKVRILPTSEAQTVSTYSTPISIQADVDTVQEIVQPLDKNYEADTSEAHATPQANSNGTYSYSVDFRNASNTWVDEFTVDESLNAVEQGYAKLQTLTTPQTSQDYDGKMNVWYKTTKTPSDYTETEPAPGVIPSKPESQPVSPTSQGGAPDNIPAEDKKVLSACHFVIGETQIGSLDPSVTAYDVKFHDENSLLSADAPSLDGLTGSDSTTNEWSYETTSNVVFLETAAKIHTVTIKHGSKTYVYRITYTTDAVDMKELLESTGESNQSSQGDAGSGTSQSGTTSTDDTNVAEQPSASDIKANATLSDGHENNWIHDPAKMKEDADGDSRLISYDGWKLWKADVGTAIATKLDAAALNLAQDERIIGIRFEYGRVEASFATKTVQWERDLVKDKHDDSNSITGQSNDTFDEASQSVDSAANRMTMISEHFTTEASKKLEKDLQDRKDADKKQYEQDLKNIEKHNTKILTGEVEKPAQFKDALTLPVYTGNESDIDKLVTAKNAACISVQAAFEDGTTSKSREALVDASVETLSEVKNVLNPNVADSFEQAIKAYESASANAPSETGGEDLANAKERLLGSISDVFDSIITMGLSGQVMYAPATLDMEVTNAYSSDAVLVNSTQIDAYRNGGGTNLEAHDADAVEQKLRQIPKTGDDSRKNSSPTASHQNLLKTGVDATGVIIALLTFAMGTVGIYWLRNRLHKN